MREKYRATLIGTAIGDTLGMPVVGWTREQIKRYVGKITEPINHPVLTVNKDEYGPLKHYGRGLEKGQYSDDTILTLALAESIVAKKGLDLHDIALGQLYEYTSRKGQEYDGGFGGTTREAFGRLLEGVSPLDSGVIGGPGNAPAMKMSPAGLFIEASQSAFGIIMAKQIGKITHLDPRSQASGAVQAIATHLLLTDIPRNSFLKQVLIASEAQEEPLTEQFTWHKSGNLTSRIKWVVENKDANEEEAYNHLGCSSVVYKSYPFALFMFQKYWDNPIEGLIETVNFGGDCDTTGAMVGALIGAKNGMIFPTEWLDVLQGKERLIAAADGIFALRKVREEA